MTKLKGLKKAVGDYQRANSGGWLSGHYGNLMLDRKTGELWTDHFGGWLSGHYGNLMLDRKTGELWTDHFYSVGHNEWKIYHGPEIIDLEKWAKHTCRAKDIRSI